MGLCKVGTCGRAVHSGGMCAAHYQRRRSGSDSTDDIRPRKHRGRGDVLERDSAGRKFCTKCEIWKSESDFRARKRSPDGLNPHCRTCLLGERRAKKFGTTEERLSEIHHAQGGACAICKRPEGEDRSLAVDHDHSCCPENRSCGKCIRGLLCSACNTGLGMFGDDIEVMLSAIEYLRK